MEELGALQVVPCGVQAAGVPGPGESRFERELRGGGDGVPAAASPKPWETPPDSRDRAGTRDPAPLSSECAIFQSQVLWAAARLGRRRLRPLLVLRRPLPLSTSSHPYPSRVEVQRGRLQGHFRCQTFISDSAALDSDVSRVPVRLCGCGCSEARAGTFLFSVSLLFEGLLDSFFPHHLHLKETFGPL